MHKYMLYSSCITEYGCSHSYAAFSAMQPIYSISFYLSFTDGRTMENVSPTHIQVFLLLLLAKPDDIVPYFAKIFSILYVMVIL